ncbi:MAG: DUF1932 domain-containing protein [Proteobacteria bacterium]|nr:DUF1932 domain-containing protein [Pseudomonadota bacterium]
MYDIGFIGFGEAAQAFVDSWKANGVDLRICAWDILLDDARTRADKLNDCASRQVHTATSATDLASQANLLICAVTASQVLQAARSVGSLPPDTLYLDINSVAPEKKKTAAALIGDGYIDVAVLSPVHPLGVASPMLLAGPRVQAQTTRLTTLFGNAEVISTEVGAASLVKMIRSIFVKGLESITMECALAAHKSNLSTRVFPSLDNTLRFTQFKVLADYTMERVATHGIRRSEEMREVCDTLADLGLNNTMSAAAVQVQQAIGDLHLADTMKPIPADSWQIADAVFKLI